MVPIIMFQLASSVVVACIFQFSALHCQGPFETFVKVQPSALTVALTVYFVFILTEAQLLKNLFKKYNSKMRPVFNENTPVYVTVDYILYSIKSIKWVDEFLTWNKSDYGNKTSIVLKAGDVWKPEISVRNGPATQQRNEIQKSFLPKLNPSERLYNLMNDVEILVKLKQLLQEMNDVIHKETNLIPNKSLWIEMVNVVNRFFFCVTVVVSSAVGMWLLCHSQKSDIDDSV
ncbi:hypothetical protein HELRODRAFT_173469 [Helobdella robusta]|uniref:Neurotransmitter-gated ion-channel ligand-binding domain-containing protein n=1 Tax=Helobdella robusta TaxID=6412 RepID=T1F6V1_HELRO|nr:hypothetical protein HELRODRAFT_173469 [Helobdella robusta]ESO03768.1 hypothetical protein HELRODRAFT_173469 [Helobdella robusta]